MNRFNDKNELITYLENVFDLELNLYTQKQLMARMKNTFGRLGRPKTINQPKPPENRVSVGASMYTTGIVGGNPHGDCDPHHSFACRSRIF